MASHLALTDPANARSMRLPCCSEKSKSDSFIHGGTRSIAVKYADSSRLEPMMTGAFVL